MTIALTQANRPFRATTPLGDGFVPVALIGEEEISRPFLFTLDLVSTTTTVAAASILGKPVTLHLPLAGGGSRPVHGLVRRFTNLGPQREVTRYRAEIVPALWFLSLSSDCRTFENQSPLEIVETVCKGAGVTDLKRRLTAEPVPIPYVVQYRESDLAFVSRLLEVAGLYYSFDHADGKHTLVFSDSFGTGIPAGRVPTVTVNPRSAAGNPPPNTVHEVTREQHVVPANIAVADHDLLRADDFADMNTVAPGARGRQFDFLGDLGPNASSIEVIHLTSMHEATADVVRGRSNCTAFQADTRVTMTRGPFPPAGTELHLLRVRHTLDVGDVVGTGAGAGAGAAKYDNEFEAIPAAATFFRPPRVTPRPSVRGTHTAKVVGTGGVGEIDVDAEGRVLLQFPWDRGAGFDGKSKHRVHVASVWAGTGWGFVQLPRIGQEVLIEYMEGDVSRPIVTGRVFNATHKPPYALPANKTQSGVRSRTLGGGDTNFNEIRFEDKKGSEHVHVQAEKDLQTVVKNSETRSVGNARTTTVTNDDTRTVTEGNDLLTVKKGDQKITVAEGDRIVTVGKGDEKVTIETGDQRIEVQTGDQEVRVKGDQKITVEDGDRKIFVGSGDNVLTAAQGDVQINTNSGDIRLRAQEGDIKLDARVASVLIEAMKSVELKVGPTTIKLTPSGVEIKGPTIKIQGDGQVEVKGRW